MSDVEIDWGVDSQASKTIGSTYWGGIWTCWVVGATYTGVLELALELKTRLLFVLGVIFVEVFMVSVVVTVVLVLGNELIAVALLIIVVTVAGTVIGSNAIICVVALLVLVITTFVFVEVLVLEIVWFLVDKSSTVVYTVIV